MLVRHAQLTGHNGAVYALADAGATFLSAGGDGWLVQWHYADPEPGRVVARIEGRIFSFYAFPDRPLVVAGDMAGGVRWIDLENPAATQNVAHHRRGTFAVQRRGEWLYTVGGEGRLTRWSVAGRRTVESIQLSGQALRSLAIHPGLPEAVVGSSDGNVYLLDLQAFQLRRTIAAHANSVFSLCYSPDGSTLYSGSRDARLKAWSVWENYQLDRQVPAHLTTINALVFSPDGHYLASAGRDKTVKIWQADTLRLLKVLEGVRDRGHFNSVNALCWGPEGLLSAGDDRVINWWTLT